MDIPKVLLTSATLVPKTLSLLGVEDCDFKTMPSTIPKEHRWFTHLPTLKINYSTTLGENKVWVKKVDKIIQTYRGKGIIHTVSYKRRDFLLTHSRYRSRMITHNSENTEEVIEKFRKAEGGILVSPSITTGYDFPGDQCRWQIIVKLPFPNPKGVLRYEQHKQDPEFTPYMVAQTLVQAVGRGVRSADDYCQTFILDDNVAWFMRTYKRFFPSWFLESYRKRITIPKQKEK
jgi:Rad3-related DNA helicase